MNRPRKRRTCSKNFALAIVVQESSWSGRLGSIWYPKNKMKASSEQMDRRHWRLPVQELNSVSGDAAFRLLEAKELLLVDKLYCSFD
jgi:hypothetical protein